MGTCITCDHCTDVTIDWDGTPYMCYGAKIGCSGAGNFTCKRYKLDPDIKFFKYKKINTESPDCELKKYIDQRIKELHEHECDVFVNLNPETEQTQMMRRNNNEYSGIQGR
jgi:hypothetical protein